MAFFRQQEEKKGLSLPGLIDIIFLLLIFSLVTLSFSNAKVDARKRSGSAVDFNLPEAKIKETFEVDNVLQTLLFQIEYEDPEDFSSSKVVYVLWPSLDDSLTVLEAKNNAIKDSLFAVFPTHFLTLNESEFKKSPPCSLIHWAIQKYKDTHFFEPQYTNAIEIRAVKNTEFRIVNFIMEQCSAYGDTIPRILLHTLSGRER